MRKGDANFMMYMALAVILLLALVWVIIVLRGKNLSIIDMIREALA